VTKSKMVRLNEQQYSDLIRAKATHELETGRKLSGFGAAIAILASAYLLSKRQPQQGSNQRKPIMGIQKEG